MPTFLFRRHPNFRILDPATFEVVVPMGETPRPTTFVGGRLTMDEKDPHYALVMETVRGNPEIVVMTNLVTCQECGEPFGGQTAKANLAMHRKTVHPNEYLLDMEARHSQERNAIIQAGAGFACDACGAGIAVFPSQDELVLHTRALHGAPIATRLPDGTATLPEELRDQLGSDSGGPDGDRAVGSVATAIPAATAKH